MALTSDDWRAVILQLGWRAIFIAFIVYMGWQFSLVGVVIAVALVALWSPES